jgi:hypothetical protein
MRLSVAQSGLKRSMLPRHDLPADRQWLAFNSCVPGEQRRSGKPEPGWQAGRAPTPRPPQPNATRATTTTGTPHATPETARMPGSGNWPRQHPRSPPPSGTRSRSCSTAPGRCLPGHPARRRRATEHNRSRGLAGKNARNQPAMLMAASGRWAGSLTASSRIVASRACVSASPGANAGRPQQFLRSTGLAGELDALAGPWPGSRRLPHRLKIHPHSHLHPPYRLHPPPAPAAACFPTACSPLPPSGPGGLLVRTITCDVLTAAQAPSSDRARLLLVLAAVPGSAGAPRCPSPAGG